MRKRTESKLTGAGIIYDFIDFGRQLLNGKRLGDEVDASIGHAAVHDGIPRKTGT